MKKLSLVLFFLSVSLLIGCSPSVSDSETQATPTPESSVQPQEEQTTSNPQGWETYSNPVFSFNHPSEASVEEREYGTIVTYMGPTQVASGRTQTELFDGYSLSIEPIPTSQNLRTVAELEQSNAEENCLGYEEGKISPLTGINLAGEEAYQFVGTNCYIDYTTTILQHNDTTYRISQTYVGTAEDQQSYKMITDSILSSFSFIQ